MCGSVLFWITVLYYCAAPLGVAVVSTPSLVPFPVRSSAASFTPSTASSTAPAAPSIISPAAFPAVPSLLSVASVPSVALLLVVPGVAVAAGVAVALVPADLPPVHCRYKV